MSEIENNKRVRINREDFFEAVINAVDNNLTEVELATLLKVKKSTITQRLILMNKELREAGLQTYKLKSAQRGRKAESFADIAKAKLEAIKSL